MKLSELVAYKNQLESISVMPIARTTLDDLEKINHVVKNNKLQMNFHVQQLQNQKEVIHQAFDCFESNLQILKQEVQELITHNEKALFQKSYSQYEKVKQELNCEQLINAHNEQILNRTISTGLDPEQIQLSRIARYSDWRQAAVIIRPAREIFIEHMVANDPLYILDESHDLLKPAMSKFNELYQNRLRPYVVDEDANTPLLIKIPDAQIGTFLVYNFFNYKPFEVIKNYLEQIYQKLRPGGILLMTFNDCDRYKAVILAESGYACYTPGGMVRSWAKKVGFEEIFCYHDDSPSTWIEFRKPGEFVSLRGGQALAKILPKTIEKSK
jgi:hypothetical protein